VERGEQLETATFALRKYLSKPIEGNQPAEAQARMHLGMALAAQGDKPGAAKELTAALELDSSLEIAKSELKRLNSAKP